MTRVPCGSEPLDNPAAAGLAEPWVHGTRLGREHTSLRRHLVEDHHANPGQAEMLSDGAAHGIHDRQHDDFAAYAVDLSHDRLKP